MAGKRETPLAEGSAVPAHAKVRTQDFTFGFILSDVVVSACCALAVFHSYARPLGYDQRQLWIGLGGFALAWPFSAYMQELYGRRALLSNFRRLFLRTITTCALTFGLILLLGFGFNMLGGVSRVWLLTWAATVFGWTAVTRLAWRGYLRERLQRGDCLERAVVLASSSLAAHRLGDSIVQESGGHLRVVAAVALPETYDAPALKWVEDMVRRGAVDRVVVGHFSDAIGQTNALLARLTRLAIDVTLLPNLEGLQAPVQHVDRIGMLPAIELDFRPLTSVQAYMKRLEDLVLAGALIVFLLPVLLLVSVAIKLDSRGSVLFRQARAGFNGQTFTVWKFRTMYAHARDDGAVQQTSRGDRRVTRVGRFLRRTSLDELPQLFNVLFGDMSIVGPRPHALGMTTVGLPVHEAIEEYTARHRLKPGITGWAQVNGSRGEVDSLEKLQRRVALDCHYIENWSLAFDFWIILRTAAMVLSDPNAY